ATNAEIICLLSAPLLGLVIASFVNRLIDRRADKTLGFAVLNFTAPLLSSALTILFAVLALQGLQELGVETHLLHFGVKLAVAWFAIQLAIMMSSRQSVGWLIACFIIPVTLLHMFNLWDGVTRTLMQVSFTLGSVEMNLYLIFKGIVIIVV